MVEIQIEVRIRKRRKSDGKNVYFVHLIKRQELIARLIALDFLMSSPKASLNIN